MELAMWILVGIVAGLGFVVLVPVLVVGTWFVVITVILGLADATIWLLDLGWKKKREAIPKPLRLVRAPLFRSILLTRIVASSFTVTGPNWTYRFTDFIADS